MRKIYSVPKYPGGYPISRILLSQGGGSSSCTIANTYKNEIERNSF